MPKGVYEHKKGRHASKETEFKRGHARDSKEVLKAMIEYLEKNDPNNS